MKKITAIILILILSAFTLAGCGGGSPSIIGEWTCTGMSMQEGDTVFDEDTIKAIFGDDFSLLASFSASEDGTGELFVFEDSIGFTWEESDNGYALSVPDTPDGAVTATVDGDTLKVAAEIDGTSLTLSFAPAAE